MWFRIVDVELSLFISENVGGSTSPLRKSGKSSTFVKLVFKMPQKLFLRLSGMILNINCILESQNAIALAFIYFIVVLIDHVGELTTLPTRHCSMN